jgi:hypothetical protein
LILSLSVALKSYSDDFIKIPPQLVSVLFVYSHISSGVAPPQVPQLVSVLVAYSHTA